MIKYIQGNVLDFNGYNIIAHCCNTLGRYKAGVALAIANAYPQSVPAFLERHSQGLDNLGTALIVGIGDNKYIANCYAQDSIGTYVKQLKEESLRTSLQEVYEFARHNDLSVGVPFKIGCGLAGGNWDEVEEILESIFSDVDCYICKL